MAMRWVKNVVAPRISSIIIHTRLHSPSRVCSLSSEVGLTLANCLFTRLTVSLEMRWGHFGDCLFEFSVSSSLYLTVRPRSFQPLDALVLGSGPLRRHPMFDRFSASHFDPHFHS